MSNEKPKKIFVGYEEVGGIKIRRFKYGNLTQRHKIRTPDLFQEANWDVKRINDRYYFSFQAARHGGGVDVHEITKSEFLSVLAEEMSFDDLISRYDK